MAFPVDMNRNMLAYIKGLKYFPFVGFEFRAELVKASRAFSPK